MVRSRAMNVTRLLVLTITLIGCGGSTHDRSIRAEPTAPPTTPSAAVSTEPSPVAPSMSPSSGPAASAAPPPAPPTGVCDPAATGAALASFDRAKPFLAKLRAEAHPSKDEWDENMALLLAAAEAGLLEAQYEYGRTLFGARFTTQAPQPKEEADYVRALQFVRTASTRGHAPAKEMFPQLAEGVLPAKLDVPLKNVPRAWIDKAAKNADAWLRRCASTH